MNDKNKTKKMCKICFRGKPSTFTPAGGFPAHVDFKPGKRLSDAPSLQ